VNSEGLWTPGFYAVAVHRFGAWVHGPSFPGAARPLAQTFYQLMYLTVRNLFGIQLPWTVRLGRRVRIAHQHGIVVHPGASLGDDCVVRQGVTVGAASSDPVAFLRQAPQIGARVSLGAGCVVVGSVRVGDDAQIGPNAVVMTHVPAGATVLAQPPRIIRKS
jgi:serine O-acetyltransferase